jgi:hypothetical protein
MGKGNLAGRRYGLLFRYAGGILSLKQPEKGHLGALAQPEEGDQDAN